MFWSKRVKVLSLLVLALVCLVAWILFIKVKSSHLISRPRLLKHFPFSEEDNLGEWEEKVFKGYVEYTIENFRKETCIYARSKNDASALYHKIKIDMERHPILSWKWSVIKFPKKAIDETLIDAEEDDYGARMYVIFPPVFLGSPKALEYVWTEYIPEGTISSSPYSSDIKLIVLKSGKNKSGRWVYEKRDLYQDYIKAFGKEPRLNVGAIAFMTDSDSTGTSAEAVYDEIKIEYKKEVKP